MSSTISRTARRFFREEDGATAIEYAVVAAILGVAVVGTVGEIRDSLNLTFNTVSADMAANTTP